MLPPPPDEPPPPPPETTTPPPPTNPPEVVGVPAGTVDGALDCCWPDGEVYVPVEVLYELEPGNLEEELEELEELELLDVAGLDDELEELEGTPPGSIPPTDLSIVL